MGYSFYMNGQLKFSKELPENVKAIFREMNNECELGRKWYRKNFQNRHICAEWCPWIYDEENNGLEVIDCVEEYSHNYWFLDWLVWIIESFCIPNGIEMNGKGHWEDGGKFTVAGNVIETQGHFDGSDDYKRSIRRLNRLLKKAKPS